MLFRFAWYFYWFWNFNSLFLEVKLSLASLTSLEYFQFLFKINFLNSFIFFIFSVQLLTVFVMVFRPIYSPVMRRDSISIRYRQVSILRRWSIVIFSRLELLRDEHSFIIWCGLMAKYLTFHPTGLERNKTANTTHTRTRWGRIHSHSFCST